ncbi:ead/Ea22-like family protein [Salmonella enterica]|uniref:ead/Ea22-like family protein n=1 Tax=Salmonella enterica TaxID=28901 RepID=UPI0009ADCAB3|nr:ead/Ea22-like family protein [Salmonella enterica]
MSNIDKQALREAAEKATKGPYVVGHNHINQHGNLSGVYVCQQWKDSAGGVVAECHVNCLTKTSEQVYANAEFIAVANPRTMLALLDELKSAENNLIDSECHVAELEESLRDKQALLEAAEKRIAEQSKAASVDSQWKPDVCPITGRRFFMWIEHPSLGYVPTYGGPFDSYTIPTRDSNGEFSCERYDHDFGGWVEGEFIGLYLIDDDEQCRVCELEERIAELEAREIKPANGEVLVTVAGFTGCGKSAIVGEIEIAMKAIGVPVQWTNGDAEKCMTGADWLTAIEMYKPNVRIVEVNVPRTAGIKVKGE